MPLRIVQASNTSTTSDEDRRKLIALSIDAARSNPLTRCMLRQPDSYASHKQIAEYLYDIAVGNDETRIFMALNPSLFDLRKIYGSVVIQHWRVGNPISVFEKGDLERLDVKVELFQNVQTEADNQRREMMQRDYYCTFHRVKKQRALLIVQTRFADYRTHEHLSHSTPSCQPKRSPTNRNAQDTGVICSGRNQKDGSPE